MICRDVQCRDIQCRKGVNLQETLLNKQKPIKGRTNQLKKDACTHVYIQCTKEAEMKFSCIIELNCKEEMKMYVDIGRVVTTVSIQKIQVDYGGNSHTKEFQKN